MRSSKLTLSMLMASAAIAATAVTPQRVRPLRHAFKPQAVTPTHSRSKRYPQMVTSSDAEIREWNRNVNTRQVRRAGA